MSSFRIELTDGGTGSREVICRCPTRAEATYWLRQRWLDNLRAVDEGYPGFVSSLDEDGFEIRKEPLGPRVALYRAIEEP
jgi:hypothetical protein